MAGLSEEPEGKRRVEEIVAVDETHAAGTHGALDLFLEVVVDAEALEVVDGDHHVPAAAATLLTLTENISYVRQALPEVKVVFAEQRQRVGRRRRAGDDGIATVAASPAVVSICRRRSQMSGEGEDASFRHAGSDPPSRSKNACECKCMQCG